jgi:hypothetical protein
VVRLAWTVFALGVAALVMDRVQPGARPVSALEHLEPGDRTFGVGGFAARAVYPTTDMSGLPAGLETRGSWIQSDAFEGSFTTAWFKAARVVRIKVAGYPAQGDSVRLDLEVRRRDGSPTILPYRRADPGERWSDWIVRLPADVLSVRIRAVDSSTQARGWLAFSAPFTADGPVCRDLWSLLQIAATTCLALTLLYAPGLLWFAGRQRGPAEFALATLVGPLAVAALGVVCWAGGGRVSPATLAGIGVAVTLAVIGFLSRRRIAADWARREIAALVGVGALLAGFAVAKANLSYGPKGELYEGTVSRTLEASGHPDSRISYFMTQLIAQHLAPGSPEAAHYYAPWSLASRGPLAGLIAAPIVLATGAQVPEGVLDEEWRPFDRQGFVTYRITLIVLASLAAWAVFGVTAGLMGPAWGWLSAITTLLAPFFVHEMYFTWPKMIAATCVLAAFQFGRLRQGGRAGLALGVGYLFHPLALLSAPFLAVWLLGDRSLGPSGLRARQALLCCIGTATLAVPWYAWGHLHPAMGASQDIFFSYFCMADNRGATLATWWSSRWQNFATTFVPFYLLATDQAHESINSVFGRSDGWIHFGFQYWNTLPFAIELPAFILLLPGLVAGIRRSPAAAGAVVIGPALLLIAYWGAADTGLMRQCGHVLFLATIVFGTWGLAQNPAPFSRLAVRLQLHPLFLALRVLDVAWMAFGTTLHRQLPGASGDWAGNDCLSLLAAAACLFGAVAWIAQGTRAFRPSRLGGVTKPCA